MTSEPPFDPTVRSCVIPGEGATRHLAGVRSRNRTASDPGRVRVRVSCHDEAVEGPAADFDFQDETPFSTLCSACIAVVRSARTVREERPAAEKESPAKKEPPAKKKSPAKKESPEKKKR